jgi:hypothetical protein
MFLRNVGGFHRTTYATSKKITLFRATFGMNTSPPIFDFETGDDTFLRNVCLSSFCMALQRRKTVLFNNGTIWTVIVYNGQMLTAARERSCSCLNPAVSMLLVLNRSRPRVMHPILVWTGQEAAADMRTSECLWVPLNRHGLAALQTIRSQTRGTVQRISLKQATCMKVPGLRSQTLLNKISFTSEAVYTLRNAAMLF